MRFDYFDIIAGISLFVFLMAMSYLFAEMGYPTGVWFWHDILGIL